MATQTDRETILSLLRDLDPYEFEHFVADLWESEGWETDVTQRSRDKGVDVRATRSGTPRQTMGIEAKRYEEDNKVGVRDVKIYHSTWEDADDLDEFTIVTTGSFTANGKVFAYENDVNIVDGDELVDMIYRHERFDLLSQYLDIGDMDRIGGNISKSVRQHVESTEEVPPPGRQRSSGGDSPRSLRLPCCSSVERFSGRWPRPRVRWQLSERWRRHSGCLGSP